MGRFYNFRYTELAIFFRRGVRHGCAVAQAGARDILAHVREDIPGTSLSNSAAVANAPAEEDGQFRVPKVVESAH